MREERRFEPLWITVLLVAVTAAGFWLRWLYARDVSFFVDEYLTVRAAGRILAQGVPLLPSGNFYSHGLLVSYLVAPLLGLGVTEPWLLRLPVLLLSTAAIPLLYWTGRRIFGRRPGAGLVAAALLAFAPEAILWGGRLRMYATLQFFVQLAVLIFYLWVVEKQDRPALRLLFVLAFWGALFSHAEAMLLLPLWGLWALVQRGWRWCLRPANLVTFALAGLSAVVEIGLRQIGPPVQAWVSPGVFQPEARQYLGAALDWPGMSKVLGPLLPAPAGWLLAAVVMGGLVYLVVIWVRGRGKAAEHRNARAGLPVLAAAAGAGHAPLWRQSRVEKLALRADAAASLFPDRRGGAGHRRAPAAGPVPRAARMDRVGAAPRPGGRHSLDRRRLLVAGHDRGARDGPGLRLGL